MMLPLTGIVTSIFCLSFSTLKVTLTSVSGAKNLSSFPSFSSTADFNPSVISIFLPVIINLMMSNSFTCFIIVGRGKNLTVIPFQPSLYKIYQTFFLLQSLHMSKEYIHMQLTRPKIHFCILILCKYYIIYL